MKSQHKYDFETFVLSTERALDAYIDHGTDQELFLAGYLHGHFSLTVSQCQIAKRVDLDSLLLTMNANLQDAFAQNELEPKDQKEALNMWEKLTQ